MSQFVEDRFGGPVALTVEWSSDTALDDEERAMLAGVPAEFAGAVVRRPGGAALAPEMIVGIAVVAVGGVAGLARLISYVACRLRNGCTVDLRSQPPTIRKETDLPRGVVIVVGPDGSHSVRTCEEGIADVLQLGLALS
ncbi:hypothetical protein SAMN05421812_105152 [Asanoa hainanensis]|uniref:Uncharacterized protein n=1 Tax=Asanoa hainanensis TaxID=560556 RepID=A0A239M712_9ACTN|nr:hypothetical protein [Asanoa hainanensis]SNT37938.1 hypothetical protein SAMN05421812_105152 [Asanoa hainanensis]